MCCIKAVPVGGWAGSLKHHKSNIGQMSHEKWARNLWNQPNDCHLLEETILLKKSEVQFLYWTQTQKIKKQTPPQNQKSTVTTLERNLSNTNVPPHPKGPEDTCKAARDVTEVMQGRQSTSKTQELTTQPVLDYSSSKTLDTQKSNHHCIKWGLGQLSSQVMCLAWIRRVLMQLIQFYCKPLQDRLTERAFFLLPSSSFLHLFSCLPWAEREHLPFEGAPAVINNRRSVHKVTTAAWVRTWLSRWKLPTGINPAPLPNAISALRNTTAGRWGALES